MLAAVWKRQRMCRTKPVMLVSRDRDWVPGLLTQTSESNNE